MATRYVCINDEFTADNADEAMTHLRTNPTHEVIEITANPYGGNVETRRVRSEDTTYGG